MPLHNEQDDLWLEAVSTGNIGPIRKSVATFWQRGSSSLGDSDDISTLFSPLSRPRGRRSSLLVAEIGDSDAVHSLFSPKHRGGRRKSLLGGDEAAELASAHQLHLRRTGSNASGASGASSSS
eukprot:2157415-Rhodomonas_salina.1